MNNHKEEFESKNLDHLGIIAGTIDEICCQNSVTKINIYVYLRKLNQQLLSKLETYIQLPTQKELIYEQYFVYIQTVRRSI